MARHTWPKGRTAYAGSGWAWQRLRAAVLERDAHRCRWCGGRATTADHVTARAAGGPDTMDNLVAACARCNERRRREQVREGLRRRLAGRQPQGAWKAATRW